MVKRCMSAVLCSCLIAAMFSWTAFAAEAEFTWETNSDMELYSAIGHIDVANRQSVEGIISFDAFLSGEEIAGSVFAALYAESGQMRKVEAYPAAESVRIQLECGQETDCVKVMWLDDNLAPACQAETVEAHVPEIYAKALDEEHIVEAEIEVDGETVTTMYVDNEVVIEAAEGVTKARVEELVSGYNAQIVGCVEELGYYQIELRNASTMDDIHNLAERLNADALVSDAYPNSVSELSTNSAQYYPDDGDGWRGSDWDESNPEGQNWGLEAIRVPSAWKLLMDKYSNLPSVNIGVIDSVFDMSHPDVNFDACWGISESPSPLATERTREMAASAENRESYKEARHGTHVAGIIAAETNNGEGISAISLNSNLYGVSLLDSAGTLHIEGDNLMDFFGMVVSMGLLIRASENDGKIVINYSSQDTFTNLWPLFPIEKFEKTLLAALALGRDFVIVTSAGNYQEGNPAGIDASDRNIFTRIKKRMTSP